MLVWKSLVLLIVMLTVLHFNRSGFLICFCVAHQISGMFHLVAFHIYHPLSFLSEGSGLYGMFNVMFSISRVSTGHENDRLSSVAAELQFKSLSRHSSPTEDREGIEDWLVFLVVFLCKNYSECFFGVCRAVVSQRRPSQLYQPV